MCQKKIMRKRSSDHLPEGPPKKRISPGGNTLPVSIAPGEILTDLTGKQWKLGNSIGYGGFGEIYPASDNLNQPVKNDAPYVIKVESHTNGPLFVEIHCLLRIGRIDTVNEWKSERNIDSLGMIHYVASGSHVVDEEKIRFLVLPRYEQDLEKTFIAKQKKFNIKTVILICIQIIDVLEYIHSKGYVHCDIKASNILHSLQKNSPSTNKVKQKENKPEQIIHRDVNPIRRCRYRQSVRHGRNLRPKRVVNYVERNSDNENSKSADVEEKVISATVTDTKNPNQVFLIDYGLATKYRHPDGRHKQYCNDERKAHAGTMQFCSLDAHLGATSRRSDLESLGYNLLYWLTSSLPWSDLNNPEAVQKKKEEFFNNVESVLNTNIEECPTFLYKYFEYVKSLTFESKPDYALCKKLFLSALQEYEYKNDGCLDFNNVEGWGRKPCKAKTTLVNTNRRTRRTKRTPLAAKNTPSDKPVLRKNKKLPKRKLNWLHILSDPEEILRQNNKQNKSQETVKSRERKLTESSDTSCVGHSVHNLDIWTLNPTYAMLEVFNKYRDRNANYNGPVKNGKGDGLSLEHRNGYTPAMDMILTKMCQRRTEELENETDNYRNRYMIKTRSFTNNTKKTNSAKKGTKSATSITKKIERKQKPITRSLRGYGLRG